MPKLSICREHLSASTVGSNFYFLFEEPLQGTVAKKSCTLIRYINFYSYYTVYALYISVIVYVHSFVTDSVIFLLVELHYTTPSKRWTPLRKRMDSILSQQVCQSSPVSVVHSVYNGNQDTE